MKMITCLLALSIAILSCNAQDKKSKKNGATDNYVDTLPAPFATPSKTKFAKVIGWPEGKTPEAPAGFKVTKYAGGLENPRWIYVAPNGDILVTEARTGKNSMNRITLLRDADKNGIPELREIFLSDLNKPLGVLILKDKLYVANTDGVMMYPYQTGQTKITASGKKILDLPAGGYNNHWTRNIISNKKGTKIYVSVGSGSNVAEHGIEHEQRRAAILEINPDGSGERLYASGLRNPVGMDWAPGSGMLWTAVNERDGLGDDLVPDYITSVKPGGFYGWPYAYFGQNEDPRLKGQRQDLVEKTIRPDVDLGSHTASLGLAFYTANAFPDKYHGGAFIGQHGSWNRSSFSGYRVAFVPFIGGSPHGSAEDFLTGFIADESKNEVYGRPAGVTLHPDGSLLIADDAGNTIWRVSAQ